MYRHITLLAFFAAVTPAFASELAPYQATSIALDSIHGVTYFTKVDGGYRVITTLADGEGGLPLRIDTILADGQRLTISIPGKAGETGQAIQISRAADRLIVSSSDPDHTELAVTRQ